MAITATDLQEMITHWLGCRVNGYLGSGYGSSIPELLQTPLHGPGADAAIAKLRDDIAIMAQLPPDVLNIYARPAGVDRLDLEFEVAGSFIRVDVVPFARQPVRGESAATPPGPGVDPFLAQTALLMRFDDSLTDSRGHAFAMDGAESYVADGAGGRAVRIGGASSGSGGGNVIFSSSPSLDWAAQGDICIEVVGRINSNVNRPRTFIRLEQAGGADIALIGAENTPSPQVLAGFRDGPSSTTMLGGPAMAYGQKMHMCLQRIGTEVRFYVDGVQSGTTLTTTYFVPAAPANVYIGNSRRSFIDAMDGDISWARITNGARYAGPFTPPSEP